MKAAIYQGKENIEIKELPDPVCTDDGVILENIYASICGTDVAVYKHGTGLGHKIEIGGEFGHEVVCRIKEKGANVKGLEIGDRVYPVSDKISDRLAALIEPFTVGCRAARRSFPRQGESAIVFGAGTIGIAAAISLKYFGCDKVMICDFSDYRLAIVKELGFEICNNSKESLPEKAKAYFGTGYGYKGETSNVDIYIDAAGADEILIVL